MLRLGDLVPDFEASCFFPDSCEQETIKFSDFCSEGKWIILFSHPADFTPVCTTELARVSLLAPEWEARGCKVIGLSTDCVFSHREWSKDICEYAENVSKSSHLKLNFPIIADRDLKVATLYGMLDQECHDPTNFDPQTSTPLPIRTVFILDPKRRVRLTMTYPAAVGRCFDEILRALDALQRSDEYKIATPADWKQGDEVIVRFDVKEEEADKLFPDRRAFKPYLRFTADPKPSQ
jgi:alkyl hydroperoxide reductase subunit AhpC